MLNRINNILQSSKTSNSPQDQGQTDGSKSDASNNDDNNKSELSDSPNKCSSPEENNRQVSFVKQGNPKSRLASFYHFNIL